MTWAPLEGRRIVLGISGSIGAVQAPALASRLRALGAQVQPVLTPAAQRLVGVGALRDAAGLEPVVALTGAGEHVRELLPGGADLLLLAPATANTVGQVALGLDDTPVTTFASVLLGKVPVLVAPAMHDTMWANPAVRANVERLRAMGCTVVEPAHEERAAKMAPVEVVEAWVVRLLGPRTLQGKRVLVIAGPTAEPLEPGLWLSNRSSGSTGLLLAAEAWRCGAEVEVWLGWTPHEAPPGCTVRRFTTVETLVSLAPQAAAFDAVLIPAAVGDYAAAGEPDPRTGELAVRPTPKVVDALRAQVRGPLVAFKAEAGLDDAALVARARELRERVRAVLVVANHLERVGPEATEAILVEEDGATPFKGSKRALAGAVMNRVVEALRGRPAPGTPGPPRAGKL